MLYGSRQNYSQCAQYYEAVGPLPPRLQPPLWQTLSSALQSEVELTKDHNSVQERSIMDHKKVISRHRHNWDMPATPPQYWSIGFPTTQEVLEINKCAEEININKRQAVELESRWVNFGIFNQ